MLLKFVLKTFRLLYVRSSEGPHDPKIAKEVRGTAAFPGHSHSPNGKGTLPYSRLHSQPQAHRSLNTPLAGYLHRVPEKTSHFNFRHNFAIC